MRSGGETQSSLNVRIANKIKIKKQLGLELSREYTHRYGKKHKSQEIIEWCLMNKPQIQDIGFTMPPKAMPDEYKTEDVIESYRKYYLGAKKTFLSWKERQVPEWVIL